MSKQKNLAFNGSAANKPIKSMEWGATKRGLKWSLSKSKARQLLMLPCSYCGVPPNSKYTSKKIKKYKDTKYVYEVSCVYNGIDRVDNTEHYTTSNCVTCCWICNRAKADMTLGEFKEWITRVALNFPKDKIRRS